MSGVFYLRKSSELVGVLLQYSNRLGLCEDLQQVAKRLRDELAQAPTAAPAQSTIQPERRRTARRLDLRLTPEEIEALVQAFRDGTPSRKLAEQYGLGLSSVKRLLRERGVRREAGGAS